MCIRDRAKDEPVRLDGLIARKDVLERLAAEGVSATERDLLYWQKNGVIPRGDRLKIGRLGFTFYPPWIVDLIRTLRQLQAERKTLAEIRVDLRVRARELNAGVRHVSSSDTAHLGVEHTSSVDRSPSLTASITGSSWATAELTVGSSAANVTAPPDRFAEMAVEFARVYEETVGPHIDHVEIRLFDSEGMPHAFRFPIALTAKSAMETPAPSISTSDAPGNGVDSPV